VVLLQSGKAADLAGAFGGMGSQTAFGPRGSATLLSKATTMSAVVFMITSLSLVDFGHAQFRGLGKTVLDSAPQRSRLVQPNLRRQAHRQAVPSDQTLTPGKPGGPSRIPVNSRRRRFNPRRRPKKK
jgi:protein translocase SecG subunit